MGRIFKDAPASLMAAIISNIFTPPFNWRSKVDKELSSESFRRPTIFRLKFPDCIKPSKSRPFCCSFAELYSGLEGRCGAGEADSPLVSEPREARGAMCLVSRLFFDSLMHFTKLVWAFNFIDLSQGERVNIQEGKNKYEKLLLTEPIHLQRRGREFAWSSRARQPEMKI